MPAVDDVFTYLLSQNLAGGATNWSLIRRKIMDAPATDQLVVVSEDGGTVEMPVASGLGSAPLASKGVMITVRAALDESDVSFQKANAILVALHGLRAVELVSGGSLYFSIRALTPEPVFAGFDSRGRPLHTVAFRLLTDAANL